MLSISLHNDKFPRRLTYVERTLETVVLDSATQSELFMHDPYINIQKPKSILCTPILNQGKLISIIYLENNLTIGAFTSQRSLVTS